MTQSNIQPSSGNVFVDLGFSEGEAAVLALRADLMGRLRLLVQREGWTQEQAAKRFGVEQSRVSDLMRGKWEKFSLDMLITLAARAGQKVAMASAISPSTQFDESESTHHNVVEIFNNQGFLMSTVNFSVPEDVKNAFNTVFEGQNKSAVIADLMREAVEREQRRKQHCNAVDRILANRINAPRFSEAEFNAAREEGRD